MTKATLPFLRSSHRVALALLAFMVILSVVGCSPQSTSTPQPTDTPLPTATPRPTPTPLPTPTPQPIDLVVLHTNDVVGYTEPCG